MLSSILNLLFPPQCLNCNSIVASHNTLCVVCWQRIQFITDPLCDCCGHPFEYGAGNNMLCGVCLHTRPTYAKARAVMRYDEHSRALILKLKYADQTQLAGIYGKWLAMSGKDILPLCDIIVPVPLHYWRFVWRRYNQSALLAYALQKHTDLRVIPDAMLRTRATKPQPGLTLKQRKDNVKGAFMVNARYRQILKGKSILLIDDVMTTSATISQCSKCLLAAGAMQVYVLLLARKV